MALFRLSDRAWAAIERYLPKNQPGARRVDDRRVISGIVHGLKVGCRWCDCRQTPPPTICDRVDRWLPRGNPLLFERSIEWRNLTVGQMRK